MGRNDEDSKSDLGSADTPLSRAEFQGKLEGWFPDLGAQELERFVNYYQELVRFNKVINLVSNATLRTAASIHFADSIMAGRLVLKSLVPDKPLYDIGSGNGFPGLALAILRPDLKIVLIDRDSRKVEFLKHVATNLDLKNVSAEAKDAEALGPKALTNVISRGFAPLPKALLALRKEVAVGGRYYHMKSDSWASEMAKVPSQLFSFWAPSLLEEYKLPDSSVKLAIVLTEKISE